MKAIIIFSGRRLMGCCFEGWTTDASETRWGGGAHQEDGYQSGGNDADSCNDIGIHAGLGVAGVSLQQASPRGIVCAARRVH